MCRTRPSWPGLDPGERRSARLALLAILALALLLGVLWRPLFVRRPPVEAKPEPALAFGRFASPELPLDRGLALVVFLAMDCSHCIETARLLGTFDAAAHGLRVYLILLGKAEEVEPFFQTSGAALPYRLGTPQDYAEFGSDDPPTLYLLKNGGLQAQWSGSRFSLDALTTELQRRQPPPGR